ncbi:hypothetical protein LEM8419_01052 [Neolewinella maritima]|uniref:Uncharacterized protein n=2 Tax=Neolewinella maritima TaxID=1383882 RepID=A0ABM9AZ10_9BACT|nr:hypothetical protein LEM8419_01052 [Neolewinella maritima]
MQPVGFVPAADCARVVEAYLRIDVPTGRLLVHFTNTSIAPDTRQQHFSGAVFTVRDSYRLPSWVVEQLGLPPSVYRITPGRYPSLEDDAFTSLSVRLSGSVTVSLSVDRLAA